jgi:isocitrate dehydrogenase
MMLVHIGQGDVAERVHNAWLRTIEDGVHTYDIFDEGVSKEKVGTREFAEAVVQRLGQKPQTLKAIAYNASGSSSVDEGAPQKSFLKDQPRATKVLVGVDVYLDWHAGAADELGAMMKQLDGEGLRIKAISNRGVKVWPGGASETFCSDHWRCRFFAETEGGHITHAQIGSLLNRATTAGFDFIKTENLYSFDGKPGYSHAQE